MLMPFSCGEHTQTHKHENSGVKKRKKRKKEDSGGSLGTRERNRANKEKCRYSQNNQTVDYDPVTSTYYHFSGDGHSCSSKFEFTLTDRTHEQFAKAWEQYYKNAEEKFYAIEEVTMHGEESKQKIKKIKLRK